MAFKAKACQSRQKNDARGAAASHAAHADVYSAAISSDIETSDSAFCFASRPPGGLLGDKWRRSHNSPSFAASGQADRTKSESDDGATIRNANSGTFKISSLETLQEDSSVRLRG